MIEINNIHIEFDKELVFKDFCLNISKGDKLAIIGESGIGKTTLLNLLLGFIPYYKGSVKINDIELTPENIDDIRKSTAWLPQELKLTFKTVKEFLHAPFEFVCNKDKSPTKSEINELLDVFDLDETILEKNLNEISGGQKQRISLICSLLLKKPIMLLDEPTSALDSKIKKKVTDYILNLDDITVITVTHDEYWIENSEHVLDLNHHRQL